jgi:hypothetical protein
LLPKPIKELTRFYSHKIYVIFIISCYKIVQYLPIDDNKK